MTQQDLRRLADLFRPEDLEWRVQSSGVSQGRPWVRVVPYVTNRAIQSRLDEVVGPANWHNEYRQWPSVDAGGRSVDSGAVLCGISIFCGEQQWVTKWDGAPNTEIEAVKGGLSDAMKRAAVQWGIGRYLYSINDCFATISMDKAPFGQRVKVVDKQANKTMWLWWWPPSLPPTMLPSGYEYFPGMLGPEEQRNVAAVKPGRGRDQSQSEQSPPEGVVYPPVDAERQARAIQKIQEKDEMFAMQCIEHCLVQLGRMAIHPQEARRIGATGIMRAMTLVTEPDASPEAKAWFADRLETFGNQLVDTGISKRLELESMLRILTRAEGSNEHTE